MTRRALKTESFALKQHHMNVDIAMTGDITNPKDKAVTTSSHNSYTPPGHSAMKGLGKKVTKISPTSKSKDQIRDRSQDRPFDKSANNSVDKS